MKSCNNAFVLASLLLIVVVAAPAPCLADAATADRLSRESLQLRAEERYSEAVEKARQAVDEAKAAGLAEEKPWVYAAYLHQLGTLYVQINDYENALSALSKALEIRKESDADAVPETTNALGKLYQDLGRFGEAEPLLVEVARIYELRLGNSSNRVDRARLAAAQTNVGAFYREIGKFDLAEEWLTRGLRLRQQLPADIRDAFIANSKFQLAAMHRDQGSSRTAEPFAHDAVEIWTRSGQDSQQSLASGLLLYADILRAEGRLDEAEAQVTRGLEIRKKEFGADSLRVASGLNVLGAILESREQLDEAEAAYREALKIRTARLPPEHPDLATSKAHLGALLKATGNLAEAEPLLQSALDIREKKLGPRHPDTVKSLDTLGDLMRRSGHPDRARELFRRADRYRRSSVQQIRILFGTNRQEETSGNAGLQFGRVEGGNQALTVGIAEVLVPDVRAGARAASARAQVGLNASERAQPEDVTSADHMNIREIWKSSPRELVAVARNELQQSQLYSGKTLLFLHGFNTSFNNALLRAAQLAYDLKFDGPVLVFSWPSKGGDTWWDHIKNIFNYTSDRISAANARIPFAQFLNQVVLPAGPQSIELLAHSMGNRLLLETLSDAARTPQDGIGPVIGGLILAAPDVPHTEFETFMNELRETGTLKTLYAARNDRALKASRDFWGEAPAGLIEDPPSWWQFWKSASTPEPIVVPSVETIDVSDVGLNFLNLNHDLYATNTLLVEDMRSVIQDSLHPPHQRNVHLFLRKAGAAGDYWVLRIKAN